MVEPIRFLQVAPYFSERYSLLALIQVPIIIEHHMHMKCLVTLAKV
jgi:hypothetical protein